MNARERYLSMLAFDGPEGILIPAHEFWDQTLEKWYEEGLPPGQDPNVLLGLEYISRVPVDLGYLPRFQESVEAEDDKFVTLRDEDGILKRILQSDRGKATYQTMPDWIDHPIHNLSEWENFRADHLQLRLEERLPAQWPKSEAEYRQRMQPIPWGDRLGIPPNWNSLIEEFCHRDYPLLLYSYPYMGLFGTTRHLIGAKALLLSFYDNPKLVRTVVSDLVDFWISVLEPVLSAIQPDCVGLFEDMCYNSGPLISPSHFCQFLMPSYKRLVSFFKDHRIPHVMVDSDGSVWKLIPLLLECGVTGTWPLEVQAGMDVVKVRRSFPKLRMWGGLDKRILAGKQSDIDREIGRKLPEVLPFGGYLPAIDHLIPPDSTWENFKYYVGRLRTEVEKYSRGARSERLTDCGM